MRPIVFLVPRFAIALVTPDDVVKKAGKSQWQARPNVLFELGWFYGRLGPQRLLVLVEGRDKKVEKVEVSAEVRPLTAAAPMDDMEMASEGAGSDRVRRRDVDTLREAIRRSVRSAVDHAWGKKPIVKVFVSVINAGGKG